MTNPPDRMEIDEDDEAEPIGYDAFKHRVMQVNPQEIADFMTGTTAQYERLRRDADFWVQYINKWQYEIPDAYLYIVLQLIRPDALVHLLFELPLEHRISHTFANNRRMVIHYGRHWTRFLVHWFSELAADVNANNAEFLKGWIAFFFQVEPYSDPRSPTKGSIVRHFQRYETLAIATAVSKAVGAIFNAAVVAGNLPVVQVMANHPDINIYVRPNDAAKKIIRAPKDDPATIQILTIILELLVLRSPTQEEYERMEFNKRKLLGLYAKNRRDDLVFHLIQHYNIDPSINDTLMEACASGSLPIVRLLVANDRVLVTEEHLLCAITGQLTANVFDDTVGPKRIQPLYIEERIQIVQFLVSIGKARVTNRAIWFAVWTRSTEMLSFVLDQPGIDVTANGYLAFIKAIEDKRKDMLDTLFKRLIAQSPLGPREKVWQVVKDYFLLRDKTRQEASQELGTAESVPDSKSHLQWFKHYLQAAGVPSRFLK